MVNDKIRIWGKRILSLDKKITREKLKRARELRKEMTPEELRLWNRVRANRLDGWHFRRQQIIDGFIVDFYCHKAALVIEVDGPIHRKQKSEDAERDKVLSARGLHILHFTNQIVMNNLNQVVKTILGILETRG